MTKEETRTAVVAAIMASVRQNGQPVEVPTADPRLLDEVVWELKPPIYLRIDHAGKYMGGIVVEDAILYWTIIRRVPATPAVLTNNNDKVEP